MDSNISMSTGRCVSLVHKNAGLWKVTVRNANYSAFNGYHRTPSAYSEVVCTSPEHNGSPRWRTKAKYVEKLMNA